MCLYTTQKEPKIAQEDITCYKVIRKNMTSLIYGEITWKIGKLYKTIMKATEEETRTSEKIRIVKQGFHSYKSPKDVKKGYSEVINIPCIIVECTIPKGSLYYDGYHYKEDGFTSNQLIVNKVINIKELFLDFPWNEYPYKPGQTIRVNWLNGQVDILQIENIQPNSVRGEYTGASLICEWGYKYQTDMAGKNPHNKYIIELVEQPNINNHYVFKYRAKKTTDSNRRHYLL